MTQLINVYLNSLFCFFKCTEKTLAFFFLAHRNSDIISKDLG